jgi:predicted RNA-binding protein YlxR (DUF448 family)
MPMVRDSHERPMRTCVGCRVSSAQDDLLRLRLVATPEGERRVEPAIGRARAGSSGPAAGLTARGAGAGAGRGAYLCPRRSCLDQAIKRRAFTRAFSRRGTPGLASVHPAGPSAADDLWTCAVAQVRREIDLLDRSSANPHAQSRRPGLERLLSALSCSPIPPVRPTPIDRHPRSNGQGGTSTHG